MSNRGVPGCIARAGSSEPQEKVRDRRPPRGPAHEPQPRDGAGREVSRTQAAIGDSDPVLATQSLADPNGSIVSGSSVVVEAEPLDGSGPAGQIQLGTGTTDAAGDVLVPLDLSQILGNPKYEGSNGSTTFLVYYYDANHALQPGFQADEYVQEGYDPTLQQQTLTDGNGNAVTDNASVVIRAEPIDPTTWSGSYPVVGYGSSDSTGTIDASLSVNSLLNDPNFSQGGDMTLDVHYTDSGRNDVLSSSPDEYLGEVDVPSASQAFYVSPSGSDGSDCSKASPCASLYKATQSASAFSAGDPAEPVAVYIEPGTYTSGGINCSGGTCTQSTCDLTSAACSSMQVIDAQGTATNPILIANDPDNQGAVTFERPAGSNAYTQETPLLTIYDSSWLTVEDLNLEGVQASGCNDGNCGGTGCSGPCIVPPAGVGEISVTYSAAETPPAGTPSGLTLDGIGVQDTSMSCLDVQYAEYMYIADSWFSNCGAPGDSSRDGVTLNAGNETLSDNIVQYASGNGIDSVTTDPSYPADSQTIYSNTVDNSGAFGIVSGDGSGSSQTAIHSDDVSGNAAGGVEAVGDHEL